MDRHHHKHALVASLLAITLVAALLSLATPTAVATPTAISPTTTPASPRAATVFGDTLSGGYEFTCGLRTDGTAICWGNNEAGQSDPPAGAFTSIDAGAAHACGLRTDGTADCWGDNDHGQADPPTGAFTQLAAGTGFTCGLRTNGTAECWGHEYAGATMPPNGTFSSIDAGFGHTCGPVPDLTVMCWGWNEYDQATPPSGTFTAAAAAGDSTCGLRTDGTLACWGSISSWEENPAGTFTDLEANFSNTCALRPDGTAACWGSYNPLLPPPDAFIDLGVSGNTACGLHSDGTVDCWRRSSEPPSPPPGTVFARPGDPVPPTCDTFDAFGPFPDVPADHTFCMEIEWAAAAGITTGYDDGTYRPDDKVTRQAMAAFLYRADGEPPFTPPGSPTFTDVPATHPFYDEIEWAAAAGIADGYPDGTYRPTTTVTRQAMAAFLHRAANEPPFTPPSNATFTDVPDTHPFFAEIEWLAAENIADGYPDDTYRPATTVTRQATAAFLLRAT